MLAFGFFSHMLLTLCRVQYRDTEAKRNEWGKSPDDLALARAYRLKAEECGPWREEARRSMRSVADYYGRVVERHERPSAIDEPPHSGLDQCINANAD